MLRVCGLREISSDMRIKILYIHTYLIISPTTVCYLYITLMMMMMMMMMMKVGQSSARVNHDASEQKLVLVVSARKGPLHLCFINSESLNGDLLAAVSGQPDFMLTIWTWKHELILFRIKGFSQDITHVKFSTEFPGVIVTSGARHIK